MNDDYIWKLVCEPENIRLAANSVLGYVEPEKHIGKLPKSKRDWLLDRGNGEKVLLDMLVNHRYDFSQYSAMTVFEPKERSIHYHTDWTLNILEKAVLNVVEPIFMDEYSSRVFGSIKGRGITNALKHLAKVCKDNPDYYFVQTDCRKYFRNINHDILKDMIKGLFTSKGVVDFLFALVDSFPDGIPIGIPFSQYNANLYLSPVDKWLESNPDVIDFVRNMDDIVVITPDKSCAQRVLNGIKEMMSFLKLSLKPNHRLAPLSYGIDVLGYVVYPTHVRIRKKLKKRIRRKIKSLDKKDVSDKVFKQQMASYYGWCIHGDCRHLLQKFFGNRLNLFNKMKYKRKSELKPALRFFNLDKDRFISIMDLFGKEVLFLEVIEVTIKGENKVAIKFCFTEEAGDDPSEDYLESICHYTITRSEVVMDRLDKDKDIMPFAATIKKINNRYISYE